MRQVGRFVAIACSLLATAAPALFAAPGDAGPRLCWRQLEQPPAGLGALPDAGGDGDSLWITDGAHPPKRLTLAADGSAAGSRFIVRGEDPQIFLRAPDEPLQVWAKAPGSAMRSLTATLTRARPQDCVGVSGQAGGASRLVVEALSEAGERSCLFWQLGTDPRRPAGCVPVGVPQLIGRTLPEARAVLERLDLKLGQVAERPDRQPATVVLDQEPPADSEIELATGDAIDVVVSSVQLVPAPEVVGSLVSAARELLEPLDLGLETRSNGAPVESRTVLDFEVARQDPAGGTLIPVGSAVVVETALRLPDLRGLPLAEALLRLRRQGIDATGGEVEGLAESAGAAIRVAAHRPGAGALVARGRAVELDAETATPNLRGLSLERARRRLDDRGLELRRLPPADADASWERVRRQRPAAGTTLPAGTAVTVTAGVLTPRIEGATVDQAQRQLSARGLRLELPDAAGLARWTGASGGHRLTAQRPAAGAVAAAGTAVRASLEVQAPQLLWRDGREAEELVRGLQLDPGRPLPRNDTSLRQRVVSQSPAAGTWLVAGSRMRLVLGPGLAPPPPEPRWPWLWLALVALLGASLLRPRLHRPRGLRLDGHADFGRQRIENASDRPAPPALRLRPRWDPGRQSLTLTESTRGGSDA